MCLKLVLNFSVFSAVPVQPCLVFGDRMCVQNECTDYRKVVVVYLDGGQNAGPFNVNYGPQWT